MHLSHCPACRERASRLTILQAALTRSLFRIDCPSSLELGEYQLGLLPVETSIAIARHASVCPYCTAEIETLVGFMAQPEPLPASAPAPALSRLRVRVADLVSGASSALGRPALAPAFAGLRGDDDGPLIYEAGDAQVILDVQDDEERPDRRAIIGLLLGLADQDVTVHLWRDEQPVSRIEADMFGNFSFDDLAPGQYELFVSGELEEIHIQDLQV